MNVKTVPETLFFCVADNGAQKDIPALAQRCIGGLYQQLATLCRQPIGDLQIICPVWNGPDAPSQFVFAIPMAAEFTVDAPYHFWKAPAFKCAWVEYKGPMSGIKDAWARFGTEVEKSGYKSAQSWREVYRHWVSPESPEDLTELQAGVE